MTVNRRTILTTIAGALGSISLPSLASDIRLEGSSRLGLDEDAGPAIRDALARAKRQGGGRIVLPNGQLRVDIRTEADILLLNAPGIDLTSEGRTEIRWDRYGLPLFAILGTERCSISGIDFVWSGTRGKPPARATVLGYDGTGIISPPDICAHIFVGGSSHIRLSDLTWRGQGTSNNLEAGISIYNGTNNGPTRQADCTGNIVTRVTSSDVYFGLIMSGQREFRIEDFRSVRYMVAAHVGAGHAIYVTGISENGTIKNVLDEGIPLEAPGTRGLTAATLQLRNVSKSIIQNITSQRPDGILAVLNNSNENLIENIRWSADRVPYESGLGNGNVITIAQADRQIGTDSSISNNRFQKWNLNDLTNRDKGRSANIGIIGLSGAQFDPSRCHDNSFEDIQITFSPDKDFSKGVFQSFGKHNQYDVHITNNGTSEKEAFRLMDRDTTNKSASNIVNISVGGRTAKARVQVSTPENSVNVRIAN